MNIWTKDNIINYLMQTSKENCKDYIKEKQKIRQELKSQDEETQNMC